MVKKTPADLPPHLVELLPTLPVNATRKALGKIITQHVFEVSARSLERWPLPVKRVNGKATIPTQAALEVAWAKFNAAPTVMSGHQATADTADHDDAK